MLLASLITLGLQNRFLQGGEVLNVWNSFSPFSLGLHLQIQMSPCQLTTNIYNIALRLDDLAISTITSFYSIQASQPVRNRYTSFLFFRIHCLYRSIRRCFICLQNLVTQSLSQFHIYHILLFKSIVIPIYCFWYFYLTILFCKMINTTGLTYHAPFDFPSSFQFLAFRYNFHCFANLVPLKFRASSLISTLIFPFILALWHIANVHLHDNLKP